MEPRNDWMRWRGLEEYPGSMKERVAFRAAEAPKTSTASASKSEDVEANSAEWTSVYSDMTGSWSEEEFRLEDDRTLTSGDRQWLNNRSLRSQLIPSSQPEGIPKQAVPNSSSRPTNEKNGRCSPQHARDVDAHGSQYRAGTQATRRSFDITFRPRRQPYEEPDHSIGANHQGPIKEEQKQIGRVPEDVSLEHSLHESYSDSSATEEQPATQRVDDTLRSQETDGAARTLRGARQGRADKYLCKNLNANHVEIVNVYCDSIPESLLQKWLK